MEKEEETFLWKSSMKRKTEKNLVVNGWLAQRWILNIQCGSVWT